VITSPFQRSRIYGEDRCGIARPGQSADRLTCVQHELDRCRSALRLNPTGTPDGAVSQFPDVSAFIPDAIAVLLARMFAPRMTAPVTACAACFAPLMACLTTCTTSETSEPKENSPNESTLLSGLLLA
jgi:hypothetical protein